MPEDALDPQLRICDPHHHLYPEGSPVHAKYLLDDLKRDLTSGHNVVRTCYVETSGSVYREGGPVHLQPVGETEWVMTMAGDGLMDGIVGFADLLLGEDVGEVLDQHQQAAGERFRGIRYRGMVLGQPEPPYDFLSEEAIRTGARVLQERGLLLEVFLYFDQIPSLAAFARSLPDLPIVLDHLGVPLIVGDWEGRRDEVLELWRRSLADLATCENVSLKLGGIGMGFVTDASRFSSPPSSEEIAAHWGPEIRFAIDQFGTKRCMFESNFPFDDHLCDYSTLWNTFKRVATDASPEEKADLFHDTAVRFYGLPA